MELIAPFKSHRVVNASAELSSAYALYWEENLSALVESGELPKVALPIADFSIPPPSSHAAVCLSYVKFWTRASLM